MMTAVFGRRLEIRVVAVIPSIARHVDVHQDDVGFELEGEIDPFLAVLRRADDLDVRLETEQLGDVVTALDDVIDNQHANFSRTRHSSNSVPVDHGDPISAESPFRAAQYVVRVRGAGL